MSASSESLAHARERWRDRLIGPLCAAFAMLAAAWFLPRQSIWIDETTQLSGIGMGPVLVVRWLTGSEIVPGIAPDRSPPLSYWLGQVWAAAFGPGIAAMRWMSVVCVGLAAWVVSRTARNAFGRAAGLGAGTLFALSPNVIATGVEIRSYPLFILVAALAFSAFAAQWRAQTSVAATWVMGRMAAWCVVAIYLHFFGTLLAGALLGATLIDRIVRRRPIRPLVYVGLGIGVLSAGVAPFILAAAKLSRRVGMTDPLTDAPATGHLAALGRLGYRLLGHPSIAMSRLAIACTLAGGGLLLLLALAWSTRGPRPDQMPTTASPDGSTDGRTVRGIAAALLLGFAAVAVAGVVARFFLPATPNYNIWMLPGFLVLLSAGVGRGVPRRGRLIAGGFVTLLLGGELYGAVQLGMNGDVFAHGPYVKLVDQLRQLGPARVVLIEDGPEVELAAGVYFPVRYLLGDEVWQFPVRRFPASGQAGATGRVRLRAFDKVRSQDPDFDLGSLPACEWVMTVRSHTVTAAEQRSLLAGDGQGLRTLLGTGPAAAQLSADQQWEHTETRWYLAQVSARVDVFRRVPPSP